MRNFDWLCETLLQLDGFAEQNGLVRFRSALSTAADLAVLDVSESFHSGSPSPHQAIVSQNPVARVQMGQMGADI